MRSSVSAGSAVVLNHPDGPTLQGIAALIGACVTLCGFVLTVLRGKSWFHAFRSNLDLVVERDALSAMNKRLTVETMASMAAAEGWQKAYQSIEEQTKFTVQELREAISRVAALTAYMRELIAHSLEMEKRAREHGLNVDDLRLPPMPKELAELDGVGQ